MRPTFPDWWLPAVEGFQQAISPVFYADPTVPVTISSWWRTRAHNAEVGGAPNSQHLLGTAVDLVPADGDMEGLAAFARTLPGVGFVLNEGTHVHVQAYPAGTLPPWVFEAVAT